MRHQGKQPHEKQKTRVIPLKQNIDIFYTQQEMDSDGGQCRICLQGQSANNRLLTPCKCAGSVKYIHDSCLKEWIYRKLQKKSQIVCQLCKEKIKYEIQTQKKCHSWNLTKQKITIHYKIFLFLFVLFLMNIGIAVYLLIVFGNLISHIQTQHKYIQLGVICFSIVLLIVICSVLFGIIARQFFYSESKTIGQILSYKPPQRKRSEILNESNMAFQLTKNQSKSRLQNGQKPIHQITISQIQYNQQAV